MIVESELMDKVSKLKRGGIVAWFDRSSATALVQLYLLPNVKLHIKNIIYETMNDGIAMGDPILWRARSAKTLMADMGLKMTMVEIGSE
jgi:hypothetical protein